MMKPVAILQNEATQGPGYLLDFMNAHDLPYRLVQVCHGDDVPTKASDFSGVVILGSSRSVNDNLPWINSESALLAYALRADIPVLGHCFGGQLLARSLGAEVHRNPRPHIGWGTVYAVSAQTAWLGEHTRFEAFHWHYESFSIPAKARRILFGSHCLNKGFACGRHLGLQCHLEVTEDIIRSWCAEGDAEIVQWQKDSLTVQHSDDILRMMPARMPALRRVASSVYERWSHGLDRPRIHALRTQHSISSR